MHDGTSVPGTLVVVPGPGNWYTTYCFCHSTSKLRSVYLNKQFNTGKIISVHDDGRQDETSTGVTVHTDFACW